MSSLSIAPGVAQARPKPTARRLRLTLPQDRWLTAAFLITVALSVGSCWYFYQQHDVLLYNDAYSHLDIARRVMDNATPGLTQLGGVWLPLPHALMLPFVWNDFLWRSGLAGCLAAMPCYIAGAVFLYLTIRRLTRDSRAAFIGTLVYSLNPNILYMQATPMSEPVLIATILAGFYFFVAWWQEGESKHLIWAALATCLATLSRYDGWVFYLAILGCVIIHGLVRRTPRKQVEDNLLLYGTLGGLGIALWFIWCAVVFKDPLYFQHGPYSAQNQQLDILAHGTLETYHNAKLSILYYFYAIAETLGPALLVCGVLGFVVFLTRKRFGLDSVLLLPLLALIGFYIFSLYSGQTVLYVPGVPTHDGQIHIFNARYALDAIPLAAILVGLLARRWPLGQILLSGALIVQTALTAHGGIVTFQDGAYGSSCTLARPSTLYFAQHYDGQYVLEDTYYKNSQDFAFATTVDLDHIIYQGSGAKWAATLKTPELYANWILTRPGDRVSTHIDYNSLTFLSSYTLVAEDSDGEVLFHLNSAPLVTHTLPADFDKEHMACGTPQQQAPAPNHVSQDPITPVPAGSK